MYCIPCIHSGYDPGVPDMVLACGGQYLAGTCTGFKTQCGQVEDLGWAKLLTYRLSDEQPQ